MIKILKRIKELVLLFIKPLKVKDEVLAIPKNLRTTSIRLEIFDLMLTLLSLAFSYMLLYANMLIEHKFILLGIIVFMLHAGRTVITESLELPLDTAKEDYRNMVNNEIILRGSQIIAKVFEKVSKYDEKTQAYVILPNERVLNVINRYLDSFWHLSLTKPFKVLELLSSFVMIIFSIVTNNIIPQYIFIPIIVTFTIVTFFASTYIIIKDEECRKTRNECLDENRTIINDLLRVPNIVPHDINMRISLLSQNNKKSNSSFHKYYKQRNVGYLIMSLVETLSNYSIIIFYIFATGLNNITVTSIANIMANAVIVTTALGRIRRSARMLESHSSQLNTLSEHEPDMLLILDTYNKVKNTNNTDKQIDKIVLNPFEIKYTESSENDKAFTLKSTETITFNSGDVVILTGTSGSGKSTLMKVLTERIQVEKTTKVPSTSRYLYYDEKMKFGSLSVFDELFSKSESPDLEKMKEILLNLHLWQEFSCNCYDVWQYLKEKKFDLSFSNGQKQRLVIAKILYWLDDNIDVVVMDECTSGLDDMSEENASSDAQHIMEYIVRTCNKDKKRIVVLATHQNLNQFKSKIQNHFNIHNLYFKRHGDCNFVEVR